tara:strand:- start:517 stop:2541 length:2025 start_codon:yes stop_codon:yes gene_type:complete
MSIDSAQGLGELVYRKKQAYRNNDQELQRRYQQSQELTDLLALQQLKKEKEAVIREQQAAANTNPQTIAQQTEQQVLGLIKQEQQQGLGALRNKVQQVGGILGQRQKEAQRRQKRMGIATAAQGGMIGFKKGGLTEEELEDVGITSEQYASLSAEDKREILKVINAKRQLTGGLGALLGKAGEYIDPALGILQSGYDKVQDFIAGDTKVMGPPYEMPLGKALGLADALDEPEYAERDLVSKAAKTIQEENLPIQAPELEDVLSRKDKFRGDPFKDDRELVEGIAAFSMAEEPDEKDATDAETPSGTQTTASGVKTTPARDMYQEAIDAAAVAEPEVKTDVRTAITDLLDASGASERMKLDPEKVRTDALEKRKKELNLEEMLDTQDEQLEEFEDFVRDTDKEESLLDWLGATSAASAYGGPGGFAAGYRNARLASIARKNDQLSKKRGIQNKKLELEADVLNKGIQSADQAVTTWQTEKNNTEKLMADATASDYELADSVANRRSSENIQKSKVMLQRLADKTAREVAEIKGKAEEHATLGKLLSDSVAARVAALQPVYAEVGLDLQDTDVTNAEISSKLAAASISQKMLEEAAGLIAQEQDILRRMEQLKPGSVTEQLKEADKTAKVLAGVSATQKYKEDEKGILATLGSIGGDLNPGKFIADKYAELVGDET